MTAIVLAVLGGLWSILASGLALIPGAGPLIVGAVEFFKTKAGRVVGVVLIGVAIYGYGFYRGDKRADAKCEAANLRADLAREKLATKVAKDARDFVAGALVAEQRKVEDATAKIATLEKEVEERKDKCRATTVPDRKRLRQLPVR